MEFQRMMVMGRVEAGRDTQGASRLVTPSDSGQHRFMVRNTKSGIRLFEAGILPRFTNCVTALPNLLL